jgi:hypothetical protein
MEAGRRRYFARRFSRIQTKTADGKNPAKNQGAMKAIAHALNDDESPDPNQTGDQ